MPKVKLGIQDEGQSSSSIISMALEAANSFHLDTNISVIADVGGGRGDFSKKICSWVKQVTLLDYSPSMNNSPKVEGVCCDLNFTWPLEANTLDALFSLEVIEHLENPRHFFREVKRVLKPGGYGFVSTPNNHNIFSRMLFFYSGCHRFFQDSCYPAHITALLKKDLERILAENNFEEVQFLYNFEDVIPKLGWKICIQSGLFSNSIGVVFKKPLAE
ncbi:MAG: class I SAM-dependent methyltransferase [Saprospiraceae bacterium]|jgi:2-polyprenyl-3-methyl-5-hydroxy-6-metoxy-1,4-benzoquinol methylase|nr:class I SAM-dependent methyltransferase [Saprospiraceae bacterium]